MTKYLASAALAAIIGAGAFIAPAAAQVGFGVNIGPDRPYYRDHYGPRPGVRVYTGRNAYRADDCRTRTVVRYNARGEKIVTRVRDCD